MPATRRHLLTSFSMLMGSVFLRAEAAGAQASSQRVHPRTPSDPNDESENGLNSAPRANKAMLEQRQKDIKKEIERLYSLASELKAEVEKTDATTTLSLGMVKKAEEIEKLARQIKDNAKG